METDTSDPTVFDRHARAALIATGFLICLIGFVGTVAIFDLLFTPTPEQAPQVAVYLLILSLPALGFVVACRRWWMVLLYGMSVVLAVALVITPWHDRKQFIFDLYSVRPGMTVDEVEATMGRYIQGAGKEWGKGGDERARATGTMTYRWNESHPAFDADVGRVTFEQGRVVNVEFSPD